MSEENRIDIPAAGSARRDRHGSHYRSDQGHHPKRAGTVYPGIEPDMGGLMNRIADNWRPLFTIADLIGLDWPARIREAAGILIGTEPDSDDSVLLADIKTTFEARGADRLSSEEICEA